MVAKPNSIALRIALVAAGEADLVATLKWGFEWDIAAAALIAEEAGATVSGALGQPLAFNTASGEAFGVLVTTPGIPCGGGRAAAGAGDGGRLGGLGFAWVRATKRAHLMDLRFHDLRHEAVSSFFERGLWMPEVALISGHRDARVLLRYTHLRPQDVAKKLPTLK